MKKRYLVFALALAAVLLFSACAIVNGGTANQKNHFVKLKMDESDETPMVLNVDQIEFVRYGKIETREVWEVYLIPAGDRGREHYSSDARIRVYDRESAARLYEAMGLTLD